MKTLWSKVRYGFTLVEMLVVIAIIGILMGMLVPTISSAILKAQLTGTMNNGKQVVLGIIQSTSESVYSSRVVGFPTYKQGTTTVVTNNEFATLAEYFIHMVTGEVLSVSWPFFVAPGVIPATGAENFKGTNHAWRMVGSVTESYPETAPVMWTKNLNMTSLADVFTVGADGIPEQVKDHAPYSRKGVVVVAKGGSAVKLMKDDLKMVAFTNILGRASTGGALLKNDVMPP